THGPWARRATPTWRPARPAPVPALIPAPPIRPPPPTTPRRSDEPRNPDGSGPRHPGDDPRTRGGGVPPGRPRRSSARTAGAGGADAPDVGAGGAAHVDGAVEVVCAGFGPGHQEDGVRRREAPQARGGGREGPRGGHRPGGCARPAPRGRVDPPAPRSPRAPHRRRPRHARR